MHTRLIWTLALCLGLGAGPACDKDEDTAAEEADTDTDTDADTDTDTDADCASLDTDTCAVTDGCGVIEGIEMSTDPASGEACVDFGSPRLSLGCQDEDTGCGDAETLAGATEGACDHWFPNTCIPAGWHACDVGKFGECPAQ